MKTIFVSCLLACLGYYGATAADHVVADMDIAFANHHPHDADQEPQLALHIEDGLRSTGKMPSLFEEGGLRSTGRKLKSDTKDKYPKAFENTLVGTTKTTSATHNTTFDIIRIAGDVATIIESSKNSSARPNRSDNKEPSQAYVNSTHKTQDDRGKCKNDQNFRFQNKKKKNCNWVARKLSRCNIKVWQPSTKGKIVEFFCPAVCAPSCKGPTLAQFTPSNRGVCQDDTTYLYQGEEGKSCKTWAANKPRKRCKKKDKNRNDEQIVAFFCPSVCDSVCPTPEPSKAPTTTTLSPRGVCENDNSFKFKSKKRKNCDWVAKRLSRCEKKVTSPSAAKNKTIKFFCPATCDPSCSSVDPSESPTDVPIASPNKKKIKVFILLGQSNMVGMGKVQGEDTAGSLEYAVKTKNQYRFLVDENGDWKKVVDQHVRNVFTMGSGNGDGDVKKNEWLTVQHTGTIGPEIGIGFVLGQWLASGSCRLDDCDDDDILVLKSCIGNRSLGWDLLPPGSPSFEYTDEKNGKKWHYAGYKESPSRWEEGTDPVPIGWYAGAQYDGDIRRAKEVLTEITKYMPGASTTTPYEVAGFLFWQGDKDRYDMAYASRYKENLVQFIRQLRVEFASPNAKFVLATLGQTSKDPEDDSKVGADRLIFNAQMEVSDLPEFVGNTACVYSKPHYHGGASDNHYNHNAETYMDVGLEMGRAMIGLLENTGVN